MSLRPTKILILILLLINVACYMPGVQPVSAISTEALIKQINPQLLGQLPDEASSRIVQGIVSKYYDAEFSKYALTQGMTLTDLQNHLKGIYSPSLFGAGITPFELQQKITQINSDARKEALMIVTSSNDFFQRRAYEDYTDRFTKQLKISNMYQTQMYKQQIQGLVDQVKDYYKKFITVVMSCS